MGFDLVTNCTTKCNNIQMKNLLEPFESGICESEFPTNLGIENFLKKMISFAHNFYTSYMHTSVNMMEEICSTTHHLHCIMVKSDLLDAISQMSCLDKSPWKYQFLFTEIMTLYINSCMNTMFLHGRQSANGKHGNAFSS